MMKRKKFINQLGALTASTLTSPSLVSAAVSLHATVAKIKVGLVGCGNVSRAYIPHLLNSGYAEIVSFCDIKSERAKKAATLHQVEHWYSSIDDMLDGTPFDLLVNLTDMQQHGTINRKAIAANKNVWSEKPLANTYQEGKKLVDEAEKKGVRIWAAPVVVNSPQFAFMARQINEGKLGKICSAQGIYGHSGPSWSAFFYEKLGGCLPDLGVYNIATLTGLLGPAISVSARMNIFTPEREVEDKGLIKVEAADNADVMIEHSSGAVSHIQCGFNYASPHAYKGEEKLHKISVMGSGGQMYLVGYDWQPYGVDIQIQGEGKELKRMATDRGSYTWEEGASIICRCMLKGEEPLINLQHSLHVLEIIEASRTSSQTGKIVDLVSSFPWPLVD